MFLKRRWGNLALIFPTISKDLLTDSYVISSQVLSKRHPFIEKKILHSFKVADLICFET
jgi:hypothetical protein